MNLQIKNSYFLDSFLTLKQKRWFGSDFFMSFFGIFIKSCLYFSLFRVVFLNSAKVDAGEITLYYIIINIVSLTVASGMYVAYHHMQDINTGAIIPYLLRPHSYPISKYLGNLTQTVGQLAVNLVLIFLVSLAFGQSIGGRSLCLGGISILLGFTVLYLIQAVIGCFALWFHDITRFRDIIYSLLMMLGGRLIPSDLLYSELKRIVYYTPLPYVYDVPVKILMGKSALSLMGIQFLWILILGAAYWYLFHCHVQHNIEFGG